MSLNEGLTAIGFILLLPQAALYIWGALLYVEYGNQRLARILLLIAGLLSIFTILLWIQAVIIAIR